MKYVLDTCTFFWLVDDQSELSAVARIVLADVNHSLHVPVIVLTELHRLVRKGKIAIRAPDGLDQWFRKGLLQHQAQCEPITLGNCARSRGVARHSQRSCRSIHSGNGQSN